MTEQGTAASRNAQRIARVASQGDRWKSAKATEDFSRGWRAMEQYGDGNVGQAMVRAMREVNLFAERLAAGVSTALTEFGRRIIGQQAAKEAQP